MTGGAGAGTGGGATTASRAASLPTPKASASGGGGAAAAAGKRTPVASYKVESNAATNAALSTPNGGGFKSCFQCGATKTPQWREGPEGSFNFLRLLLLDKRKRKNANSAHLFLLLLFFH